MAGGAGTRFWPWSRTNLPKQLLALAGSETMLAETAKRVRGFVPDENILVVTGKHLRRPVADALPWLPRTSILCEPVGRNTAPCVGWASLEVLARDPDGVMAVLAADHVIEPEAAFRRTLALAMDETDRTGALATFGVIPTHPATGYGYIRAGRPLDGGAMRKVSSFKEKPNLATATRYLKKGDYFWNSGMFVWRADAIWREIEACMPELAAPLAKMESMRLRRKIAQKHVDACYPELPSVSIDHGVLEKSRTIGVIPADFTWNDIGSWDALADLWPADEAGNVSRDPLISVDSGGNVVASRGKPVALVGVEDLVVVDAGDTILICHRDRCQDVRQVVARLGTAGLEKLK
ncbi:MAG: mannose-1-phosphate guanylyltransferase [Hyphomicrobiaceae bacterium]|jgi:mannose-1-phosphate guanylyltransferase